MLKSSAFILAASLLAAAPALADDSSAVFGNTTCGPTFSCASIMGLDGGSEAVQRLAATANACVSRTFSLQSSGSPFDETMGLNYNKCLYARPVQKAKQGFTMTPECCVVDDGNDHCRLFCRLLGKK